MQTILNNVRSDIGSPTIYYTLDVEPSNRTATQVDMYVKISCHMSSSQSILGYNKILDGYFEFYLKDEKGNEEQNQFRNLVIKSGSESWNGMSEHTVDNTFTLNASANQTKIYCRFKVDRDDSAGYGGTLYELETDAITIPIGHEVPSDISYTMTETNPLLVSAGISNDLIVENLSIKNFAITYTLHGGATMTSLGMYNISTPYSAPSSPFSIDLRNTTLRKNNDNTKIPLRAFVKDSFTTQGVSSETLYDFITYTPITLVETNTFAKRDGQISGKVNLSVNGTFYNDELGNVDQSNTYKPTIKYKFWKYGDTEPSTYAYTIPSSNINISGTTFNVTDYAIGSTNTSATNYFDPDYAYRVKVQVEDNFSVYYSKEKSIPVGEATWTEYPNRVDFKKITIGGVEILESGVLNGIYYEKRSDGIALCLGSKSMTSNTSRSQGGLTYYSREENISLPITFTNTNTMFGFSNVNLGNMNRYCNSYVAISSTSQIQLSYTNTSNNEARLVHFAVMGYWK